ncbi:MAG TPA: histidine kinase [Bryobacteraceae bacterium]|nr:histidine kinase [Bryobacteraceae bacterium]
MRWLFSIWRIRREPPKLREVPVLLLKATILGAILGPLMAIFFVGLFDPHSLRNVLTPPILLVWAPEQGIVWALSFFVLLTMGNWYLRSKLNGYPQSIIGTIHIVYSVISSSLAFALANEIINHLPGPGNGNFQSSPFFWRVVLLDGIVGGILALVISAFVKLRVQVERSQSELREKERLQDQLAAETARAQSMALQSQINPHFFFNTLNTISALIEIDPRAAQQMIGRLADLFRYTLGCTHSGPVSLDQELRFVRDYLAIEQARFQRRLRVELPESGLSDINVPGLVLQPLVENAIKYGVAQRLDGGTVSIRVDRNGATARISVRNTANGHDDFTEANLFRTGHALDNVRARLRLFTGNANPLEFRSEADWVECSFELETVKS